MPGQIGSNIKMTDQNNNSGNCICAHKKMENNYSGIYFADYSTGKNTNGVQRLWSSPNSLHSTGY